MWNFATQYQSYISSKIHILWRKYAAPYSYLMKQAWIPLSDIYDQSCRPIFIAHEGNMKPSISCIMKEIFNFISVLYKFISILHKSYISPISSCKIWTHEIDNMPIKIEKTMYMLNTIPSLGIQIYMTIMKH